MSTENNKDFQWDEVTLLEYSRYLVKEYARSAEWSNDYAAEQYHLTEFVNMKKREKRSPEYEIIKLRHTSGIESTFEMTGVVYVDRNEWVQCFLSSNRGWAIHSVRRLSDGEVFELGDELVLENGEKHKIVGFDVNEQWVGGIRMLIEETYGFSRGVTLYYATKLPTPKPIFTTEDKVEVLEESTTLHGVNTETWIPGRLHFSQINTLQEEWKWFSFPHNRDRYILLNKPTLSVNEVMDLYQNHSENFETFLSAVSEAAKAKL